MSPDISKKQEAESATEDNANTSGEQAMSVDETVNSDGDEEEWENVSLELIRWNILVKQIEDLNLLTVVISQRPKLANPVLPVLHLEWQQLSVVDLLDKGKGENIVKLYGFYLERCWDKLVSNCNSLFRLHC